MFSIRRMKISRCTQFNLLRFFNTLEDQNGYFSFVAISSLKFLLFTTYVCVFVSVCAQVCICTYGSVNTRIIAAGVVRFVENNPSAVFTIDCGPLSYFNLIYSRVLFKRYFSKEFSNSSQISQRQGKQCILHRQLFLFYINRVIKNKSFAENF